jgi:hypothetical protein
MKNEKRKHAVVTTKCIQAEARDKSTRVRRNKRFTEIFCRVPKKQIAEKQGRRKMSPKAKITRMITQRFKAVC